MIPAAALVTFAVAAAALMTLTVAAAALMALTVATAALVALTVAAAALMTLTVAAAALVAFTRLLALLTIAVAILAVPVATAAAAGAHLLLHRCGHLLITRRTALVDSQTQVLIDRAEHIIQQLASLQKALAKFVVHHGLTQLIKLCNLGLRRGHPLHVFVAELLAVLIDLAEKIRRPGVLIKQTDTSLRGDNLLALSKSVGESAGQLGQLRRK